MTTRTGGRAIYAAAAVERMVGVDADTLRDWQERFGSGAPQVGTGGQPLYSRDDVARLRWVAQEITAGRKPAPAEQVPGQAWPPPGDSSDPQESPSLLVLLADRDAWSAELAEFFLRTEGYAVEVCQSAAEALDWVSRTPPDVSVVDLGLTDNAGFDLCRALRAAGADPIVAMSSMHWEEQAVAAGADAFLLKPIDPLVLVSTIKDLIGHSAFLRSGGET